MYDSAGTLLYVGISVAWPSRMESHHYDKPWFRDVERVMLTHYGTEREARDMERVAQEREGPVYNIIRTRRGVDVPHSQRLARAPRERTVPPRNRVRELRLAEGLTLAQLGSEIGVKGNTVASWELRRNRIRPHRISQLAEHFGVPVSELVCTATASDVSVPVTAE